MAVQLINEKGKIRLESEIALAEEDNNFEAIIANPEYKERIKVAEEDHHLTHRIENKNGTLVSIAQRSADKIVKEGEFADLRRHHVWFLNFLSRLNVEENAKRISLDNSGEHEPTDEEVISALSEFLRNTFGAIVVGVIRA